MSSVVICFGGEWYDVTNFSHPGDGSGVYLADYHGKCVDAEVAESHATDEPNEILAEAKKKGTFMDIVFLGKNKPEGENVKVSTCPASASCK